jgi:hypothetical protein
MRVIVDTSAFVALDRIEQLDQHKPTLPVEYAVLEIWNPRQVISDE